jgi:hypothetical protein
MVKRGASGGAPLVEPLHAEPLIAKGVSGPGALGDEARVRGHRCEPRGIPPLVACGAPPPGAGGQMSGGDVSRYGVAQRARRGVRGNGAPRAIIRHHRLANSCTTRFATIAAKITMATIRARRALRRLARRPRLCHSSHRVRAAAASYSVTALTKDLCARV